MLSSNITRSSTHLSQRITSLQRSHFSKKLGPATWKITHPDHGELLGDLENPFEDGVKLETGLMGIPPIRNSTQVLQNLAERILAQTKKIPEYAHYRKQTEKYYSRILRIVKEETAGEPEDQGNIHRGLNLFELQEELKKIAIYKNQKLDALERKMAQNEPEPPKEEVLHPRYLQARAKLYANDFPTIRRIEHRCRSGQIEVMINSAVNELDLLPQLLENEPWEVEEGDKLELEIAEFDQVPEHLVWRGIKGSSL